MSKQIPTLPGAKQIGRQGPGSYTDHTEVRIVASNAKGQIILIPIKAGEYYTLPGGSIQSNESHHLAGTRETEEQTGCKVDVRGPVIAHAEEWREDEGLHQISYCYVGKLVAETGATTRLEHEWMDVEEAIRKMKECRPTSAEGSYVCERDLYFVEAYAMELKGASE